MRPTMWIEVKRVFDAALERPAEAREAFVRDLRLDRSVTDEALRLVRCRGRAPDTGRRTLDRLTVARGPLSQRTHRTGAAPEAPSAPAAPDAPLAGRYVLGARLGAGAFGSVHRATDQVTGDAVAVKLIALPGEQAVERFREEVAVLRRAKLPGIVELLDDGIESGCAFVVMRLVQGGAFPGASEYVPVPWERLAPRAVALVEALARLHWLGILHRDLKPDNVLVAQDGAVTIVDLGVAHDRDFARSDAEPQIVGTPTYMAPEIFEWKPATAATDLYAVGAMLFEAVTGRPFRPAASIAEIVVARNAVPPSVRDLAPAVPHFVADTIDALVDPDPARRPASARVLAAMLRGEGPDGARPRLPWAGPRDAVDRVVEALASGRPIDVAGGPGSGRTRILEEAADALAARGFAPAWTRPGRSPFESLVPVVGEVRSGGPDSGAARTLLEMRLALCGPVLVDDQDQLDPESRALIASLRDRGPVARCVPLDGAADDAVRVAPLDEPSLRPLFAGPDRLFHFQEDGARELWRRTLGRPSEIVREIEAWIDGGIARWEQRKIVIDRRGIERLEANLWSALPWAGVSASVLTRDEAEVAGVLELAGCPLAPADLARVAGVTEPAARLAAASLVTRGFARREPDGALKAVASVRASAGWPAARRTAVHSAVADLLPPATEARLAHLMEAARWEEAAEEAERVATRLTRNGRPDAGMLVASTGLAAARCGTALPSSLTDTLLILVVECAMHLSTTAACDAASALMHAAGRSEVASDLLPICDSLRAALQMQSARPIELTDRGVRCGDPRIERIRHAIRVFAAGAQTDPAIERRVLAEAFGWARRGRRGERLHSVRGWLARRRYRQRRYLASAWLNERAARASDSVHQRVQFETDAASALMEAAALAPAIARAASALDVAERSRLPAHAARAMWVMRSASYRTESRVEPDDDFLQALSSGIPPHHACTGLVVEAAIRMRAGRTADAARVALVAAESARVAGRPAIECLALGVRFAASRAAESTELARFVSVVDRPMPEAIRAQSLALASSAGAAVARQLRPIVRRTVSLRPDRHLSSRRLEVLSEREAHRILAHAAMADTRGGHPA